MLANFEASAVWVGACPLLDVIGSYPREGTILSAFDCGSASIVGAVRRAAKLSHDSPVFRAWIDAVSLPLPEPFVSS